MVAPITTTVAMADPAAPVSHFYGTELSGDVKFRWSRSLSAITLPALASSQVISITANPARPRQDTPVKMRLLVGAQVISEFTLQAGWHTYAVSTGPRFSPEVRLLIESDTFYPSAADNRRLGVAISEISTSSRPGRFGLIWPPLLWLLVGLAIPILGFFSARSRSARLATWVAGLFALAPALFSLFVPLPFALPVLMWLVAGWVTVLIFTYLARWLSPQYRYALALQRLAASMGELPLVALASRVDLVDI